MALFPCVTGKKGRYMVIAYFANSSQYSCIAYFKNGEWQNITGTSANNPSFTLDGITCACSTSGQDVTYNITGATGKVYGEGTNGEPTLLTTITDATTGGSATVNIYSKVDAIIFEID